MSRFIKKAWATICLSLIPELNNNPQTLPVTQGFSPHTQGSIFLGPAMIITGKFTSVSLISVNIFHPILKSGVFLFIVMELPAGH
jgi:hypothetical protein